MAHDFVRSLRTELGRTFEEEREICLNTGEFGHTEWVQKLPRCMRLVQASTSQESVQRRYVETQGSFDILDAFTWFFRTITSIMNIIRIQNQHFIVLLCLILCPNADLSI